MDKMWNPHCGIVDGRFKKIDHIFSPPYLDSF